MPLQGLGFVAGYLGRWSGEKELKLKNQPNPLFGKKSGDLCEVDAKESLAPWIYMISNGGLTVPHNQFLLDVEKMEEAFNLFHGVASFDNGTKIIDRFTEVLVTIFKGVYLLQCHNFGLHLYEIPYFRP